MTLPGFLSVERLQRLALVGAAMLFTVLLGLELAKFGWLLVPLPEGAQWQPPPAQVDPGDAQQQAPKLDVNQLVAARLFGEPAPEQAAPIAASVEDAPDTNLRLTLRGIFAMEDQQRSRALIEAANGEAEPYAVGDAIPGGASLHSIHTDRVLLQRAGRLETLRLEKDEPSGNQVIQLANSRRNQGADRILDSGTAAKLSNIRNELLNDPTKASQYLRVQPARRNGQMRGYRIYPGRNRELFREAGLRPGDIVTGINGVNLNDPTRSLQLLGDLSQAQQINLQIERGGQPQAISVTLN